MNIFISSTVYDLLDIRVELYEFLRSIGMNPTLSDIDESNFKIDPSKNSIETCLENVRRCDHFILLISQRYGPKLGSAGFKDISATHLEYLEAVKRKKPILVYARDRFVADYNTWKKNSKNATLKYNWIRPDQIDLFELFDAHCKLTNTKKNNWYKSFTSSFDLKRSLKKEFERVSSKAHFMKNIAEDNVPIFTFDLVAKKEVYKNTVMVQVNQLYKNIGSRIAYNIKFSGEYEDDDVSTPVIAPGDEHSISYLVSVKKGNVYSNNVKIEYSDGHGNIYIDTFKCSIGAHGEDGFSENCQMKKREYKIGIEPKLNILE